MLPDHDQLRKAYEIAVYSPDPSSQNVAVVYGHTNEEYNGINEPPEGFDVDNGLLGDTEAFRHGGLVGVVGQCGVQDSSPQVE